MTWRRELSILVYQQNPRATVPYFETQRGRSLSLQDYNELQNFGDLLGLLCSSIVKNG